MEKQPVRFTTILAAIIVAGPWTSAVPSEAGARSLGSPSQIMPTSSARVTQAHGEVFKAEMVDQSNQQFAKAQPVKLNDLLPEGTVVGTGQKSWAELQWPSVRTRIWNNTVVQIRPSAKQVFLQGGDLIFRLDKNRPDKAAIYDVRTKVLQARIHGTTVRLQATPYVHRVVVDEGDIYVKNLVNNSLVHLTPGVVLEIKVEGQIRMPGPQTNIIDPVPSHPERGEADRKKTDQQSLQSTSDLRLNPKRGELLFRDKFTTTTAYTANSRALLEDPLLAECGGPLDSYSLVQDALARVPGFKVPDFVTSKGAKADRFLSRSLRIVAVPSRTSYWIGPNVGESTLPLPAVAYTDLPPAGRLDNVKAPAPGQVQPQMPAYAIRPLPLVPPPAGTDTKTAIAPADASSRARAGGDSSGLSARQLPANLTQVTSGFRPFTSPMALPQPLLMPGQMPGTQSPMLANPVQPAAPLPPQVPVALPSPVLSPILSPVVDPQITSSRSDASSLSQTLPAVPGRSN